MSLNCPVKRPGTCLPFADFEMANRSCRCSRPLTHAGPHLCDRCGQEFFTPAAPRPVTEQDTVDIRAAMDRVKQERGY